MSSTVHWHPTEPAVINTLHLRTLVAVVRLGSFAEAARHLGYTSSAVSQHMTGLEKATRLQLFERDAHSIRPTAAAVLLSDRSADTLAALDSLETDVTGIAEGQIGRLRLGSFPTASENFLPRALASLAASHPNLQIFLDEDEPAELMDGLRNGELDLALVYEYDLVPHRGMEKLTRIPLLHEEMLLLSRTRETQGTQRDLASYKEAKWISTRERTAGETFLRRACAAAGFEPIIPLRSNDYDVVRGLVRSGLGVALVPALGFTETEGVVGRPLDGLDKGRHVLLVHRPSLEAPVTEPLVEALASAARAIASRHPHVHRSVVAGTGTGNSGIGRPVIKHHAERLLPRK